MSGPLPTPQDSRGKLSALDGMRGIAATWVVFDHMHHNGLINGGILIAKGFRLVDVFFVLSGFVLAYQYRTRLGDVPQIGSFIRKRIARIWPLHAAILMMMLAPRLISLLLHGPDGNDLFEAGNTHSLPALLASLTFTQTMGFFERAVWNGPSWTLSVEFFAYMTFAAVTFLARGRTVLPAIVVLAVVIGFLVANGYFLSIPYRLYFLRCLVGFFAGVLAEAVYRGFIERREARAAAQSPSAGWTIVELTAFVAMVWFMTLRAGRPEIFLFILACMALVFALAIGRGYLTALLSTPPFQRMGDWSLGIYLLHVPMLNIVFPAAGHLHRFGLDFRRHTPWGFAECAIFVTAVFVTAALSHILLERPARALIGQGRVNAAHGPVERLLARFFPALGTIRNRLA